MGGLVGQVLCILSNFVTIIATTSITTLIPLKSLNKQKAAIRFIHIYGLISQKKEGGGCFRMEKEIVDYTLIALGVSVMVGYHIWLFIRILKYPKKTVIGINAINRRYWVRAMMEVLVYIYIHMIYLFFVFFLPRFFKIHSCCDFRTYQRTVFSPSKPLETT